MKYFNSQDARSLINDYNFAIFPIHGIKENGTCTCNNPDCGSVGKHPATPDGFKSASTDIERVKQLWSGRQGLNVGIATGKPSGVFVIDIDSPEAEKELYEKFEIPETYTVLTGRGKHLYFAYDENRPVKNGTHIIAGVDVRGDGGYVAGAGSNHASGTIYQVLNPENMTGTPLDFTPCPQEIYDFINKPKEFEKPLFENKPRLFERTSDGWSIEDIKDHLSYISPDIGYDEWVKVGMALNQEGVCEAVYDEWSSKGTKYKGSADIHAHWRSFKPTGGVTYGTVVAMAKEGGWKPNTHKPKPNTVIVQNTDNTDNTDKSKPAMYYIAGKDITFSTDDNSLIYNVLGQEELSVIYGESNCGKTFFMTDLAFHIARGIKWRDNRVAQGGVMYAALEGAKGLSKRFTAYCIKNEIDRNFPFAMMPCALDFYSESANIEEFIDLIKSSQDDIGDPKLIVIDTLSRALSGGDENSGQDMGRLVNYADLIRYETKAHLAFVHHSGKNKALGARGHSSLRAAVDTEIEISREEGSDQSLIKFVKQREVEMLEDMAFQLERVTIGTNNFTEEITSCVVIPDEVEKIKEKSSLSAVEKFIYDAIIECINIFGVTKNIHKDMEDVTVIDYREFYDVLESRGYKELYNKDGDVTVKNIKSSTNSARIQLKKKGYINYNANYIWLA